MLEGPTIVMIEAPPNCFEKTDKTVSLYPYCYFKVKDSVYRFHISFDLCVYRIRVVSV
ncbi:hypothetical protein Phi40:1_gp041 [Cellulophaga phage phi40:1]|uniref:Uncharacterized protein n=1 Tax=Cellulophaga phage phi38:1 TaxID=1327977 RepID=R9ZY83_9CAUD|nr:hypothetical protein Phi38:1_gp041 [Cellulophaga phage phi38:1]AGO47906.1 hypothetical protein Phi40:1_gp041 [Cellulophaga phage phi40:1]AGO48071.1 hypothetical protein Phi38:1_gp041 [Cellulophaga phage phi38:1]